MTIDIVFRREHIDVQDITFGSDLSLFDFIVLWHRKKPDQFKQKVADVIPLTNTIYMPNGELIPKIKDKLLEHQGKGHLYTLI